MPSRVSNMFISWISYTRCYIERCKTYRHHVRLPQGVFPHFNRIKKLKLFRNFVQSHVLRFLNLAKMFEEITSITRNYNQYIGAVKGFAVDNNSITKWCLNRPKQAKNTSALK